MKIKLYTWFIVCFLGITAVTTGCNKRQEVSLGNTDSTENENDTAMNVQAIPDSLEEYVGVTNGEYWEADIDTNTGDTISIRATVNLPDTQSMNVYTTRRFKFSDASKQEFLTMLSSDGIIYSAEENLLPKSEIEHEVNLIVAASKAFDPDSASHAIYDDEEIAARFSSILESADAAQQRYNAAPDDWCPIEDYTGDKYALRYQNKLFHVDFQSSSHEPSTAISIYQQYRINENEAGEATYWHYNNPDHFYAPDPSEEPVIKAETLAHELFGADFVARRISRANWSLDADYGFSEEYETNGYVIELYRNLSGSYANGFTRDDLQFPPAFLMEDAEVEHYNQYDDYEILRVVLDSNLDVYLIQLCNPITEPVVETQNVSLLSYDVIQDIYRNEIASNQTPIDYENVSGIDKDGLPMYLGHIKKYDELSLRYLRIADPNEPTSYKLIPAWCLIANKSTGTKVIIALNAIDGSVINLMN